MQDWARQWQKDKNFDFVIARKTESRSQRGENQNQKLWLTADGVYENEGWAEENKHTPTGERAALRAEAVLA
eukprot:10707598-Alexandrium_andersonii.AAC.1